MELLTTEEIDQRASELSKKLLVKVQPLVFMEEETGEQIIAFIQEPSRVTKMRVLDKAMQSPMLAASELLENVLIKEASDSRILSELPENDKYYLGAVMASMGMIKYSQDTFKKK